MITTTTDPTSAVPLLQRTYHTTNSGIPPYVFVIVFVILIAVILAQAVALGRIRRD